MTSSKSPSTKLTLALPASTWSKAERLDLVRACIDTGITVPSMCLSGHRRYPFGSHDPAIREEARRVMEKAIRLAVDCGIRTIQLAGYDVYYEEQDEGTIARFTEGMQWATRLAASNGVMLAVEIMDTAFMNSISRWKAWDEPRRGSPSIPTSAI